MKQACALSDPPLSSSNSRYILPSSIHSATSTSTLCKGVVTVCKGTFQHTVLPLLRSARFARAGPSMHRHPVSCGAACLVCLVCVSVSPSHLSLFVAAPFPPAPGGPRQIIGKRAGKTSQLAKSSQQVECNSFRGCVVKLAGPSHDAYFAFETADADADAVPHFTRHFLVWSVCFVWSVCCAVLWSTPFRESSAHWLVDSCARPTRTHHS